MTISEAYDAALQEAVDAGLPLEEAKDAVDVIEEAQFHVEAQHGIGDQFCFYGIKQGWETIASTWGTVNNQDTQLKLARLFASAPDMLKALHAVIAAGFDCTTDEQFAAIDAVEAAIGKAEDGN